MLYQTKHIFEMANYIVKTNSSGFLNEFGNSIIYQLRTKGDNFRVSPKQMDILKKHGVPPLIVGTTITKNGLTLEVPQSSCKAYKPTANKDDILSSRDAYEVILVSLYRGFHKAIGSTAPIPHDLLDNQSKYLPYIIPTDSEFNYFATTEIKFNRRVIQSALLRDLKRNYGMFICAWILNEKLNETEQILNRMFSEVSTTGKILCNFSMQCTSTDYWFEDVLEATEEYFHFRYSEIFTNARQG